MVAERAYHLSFMVAERAYHLSFMVAERAYHLSFMVAERAYHLSFMVAERAYHLSFMVAERAYHLSFMVAERAYHLSFCILDVMPDRRYMPSTVPWLSMNSEQHFSTMGRSCPEFRRCSPRSHPNTRSFRIPCLFSLRREGRDKIKLL